MNYKLGALVSLGVAALLLFIPASLCQPNPMYPDSSSVPQMCVSVPNYQAISLGWASAQGSLVFIVGLAILGLLLLTKKDGPASEGR